LACARQAESVSSEEIDIITNGLKHPASIVTLLGGKRGHFEDVEEAVLYISLQKRQDHLQHGGFFEPTRDKIWMTMPGGIRIPVLT
jgi:hypothetical protein